MYRSGTPINIGAAAVAARINFAPFAVDGKNIALSLPGDAALTNVLGLIAARYRLIEAQKGGHPALRPGETIEQALTSQKLSELVRFERPNGRQELLMIFNEYMSELSRGNEVPHPRLLAIHLQLSEAIAEQLMTVAAKDPEQANAAMLQAIDILSDRTSDGAEQVAVGGRRKPARLRRPTRKELIAQRRVAAALE